MFTIKSIMFYIFFYDAHNNFLRAFWQIQNMFYNIQLQLRIENQCEARKLRSNRVLKIPVFANKLDWNFEILFTSNFPCVTQLPTSRKKGEGDMPHFWNSRLCSAVYYKLPYIAYLCKALLFELSSQMWLKTRTDTHTSWWDEWY